MFVDQSFFFTFTSLLSTVFPPISINESRVASQTSPNPMITLEMNTGYGPKWVAMYGVMAVMKM